MNDYRLSAACRTLRAGGVIAYPTEAVWGLGCAPRHTEALKALLAIKGRDGDKGLILVASDASQFAELLEGLPDAQRNCLAASWPGPVTWLVPHLDRVHPLVRGRFSTVALRVSAHPRVAALCARFGGPVVSTSANPQGRPPAKDVRTVRRYFGGTLDYVLTGALGGASNPSEIRDLASGRVLRPS